jgi:hypothetical protein
MISRISNMTGPLASVFRPNVTPEPTEQFNYNDFASTSGLTLLGSSQVISNAIFITTTTSGGVGNVYRTTPIRYDRNFTVRWSFYCGDGTGADGFTIQWTLTNNSTGLSGGGCGRITSAKNAISFLTFSNNDINWYENGSLQSSSNVTSGLWRQLLYYWAEYDHLSTTMKIYHNTVDTKPVSANYTFSGFSFDNLNYYMGFGAGTGGSNDDHKLLSWNLSYT